MDSGSFSKLLHLVTTLMAWLSIPVIIVCLYDYFVLKKERPAPQPNVDPPRPPFLIGLAWSALPFVLIAVAIKIGIAEVFGWLRVVAVPLSWLAAPVALWCAIDSWIFAPRRAVAAGVSQPPDPLPLRIAYAVLPVLVLAIIVRLITAESLDFSLVLLLLSLATGSVWLLDHLFFRKSREAAAASARPQPVPLHEPGTVDYARSFFPVAFIVLLVRAFIFEPFRIPSDSMMPTLLDGDFIVVSKYSYGLRWPVLNQKFLDVGSPQRGDVVVFRYPPKPEINYIKRLVGLPGDRVEIRADHLVINGQMIEFRDLGEFQDNCYEGMSLREETLGEHTHQVLSCRSDSGLASGPVSQCNRQRMRREYGGWICPQTATQGGNDYGDSGDRTFEVVPPGHYLMIGDNRDNSEDSRRWGYVPDANLVGKATRIWFNFDQQRDLKNVINWSRIGDAIP